MSINLDMLVPYENSSALVKQIQTVKGSIFPCLGNERLEIIMIINVTQYMVSGYADTF